jgi:hypothetical protein
MWLNNDLDYQDGFCSTYCSLGIDASFQDHRLDAEQVFLKEDGSEGEFKKMNIKELILRQINKESRFAKSPEGEGITHLIVGWTLGITTAALICSYLFLIPLGFLALSFFSLAAKYNRKSISHNTQRVK